MLIRIFIFILISMIFSNSYADGWGRLSVGPGIYSSASEACTSLFNKATGCASNPAGSYVYATGGTYCRSSNSLFCNGTLESCQTDIIYGTSWTNNGSVQLYCSAGKVITGSCPDLRCSCPSGTAELENGSCGTCPAGQVVNPYTNKCQAPCLVQSESPDHSGFDFSLSSDTCDSGCKTSWHIYSQFDSSGFYSEILTTSKPGEMCSVIGNNLPPTPQTHACLPPNVVRSDGTCGSPDPTCDKSWQHVVNHECVDKDCGSGKTMKCGTINDVQSCACTGPTDCSPGTHKDLYGNCMPDKSCTAPLVLDSVTNQCKEPTSDQCGSGTHREGLICVPDSNNQNNQNNQNNDIDHDGIPNSQDSDSDGDGTPNSQDSDSDNDGIPNSNDSTPNGPGTSHGITPGTADSDDMDGDGIPNGQDGDKDGDGIPNGQDATPDGNPAGTGSGTGDGEGEGEEESKDKPGAPVALGGSFYEAKGKTFSDVVSRFTATVQGSPLISASAGFFSVGSLSGSCPIWTLPASDFYPSIVVDFQCSPEVSDALRIAGYLVLIIAAWVAIRIALIEG